VMSWAALQWCHECTQEPLVYGLHVYYLLLNEVSLPGLI
jgi:hypothetical protein